jgi:hypothetical protein
MAESSNESIINKSVLLDPVKLDFWLHLGLNVLVEGKHGVGKTHIIQQTFERNGLKGLYLSGSTLDPWVDFIGIPEIVRDDETTDGKAYTGIVPPERFVRGEVEAIFIDELNRAPKKVRNAVMELIQFRSINGVSYPNLKVVWAAINPHDEDKIEYDVEPLDPALEDRFQIKVEIEYRPCPVFLKKRFGEEISSPAIKWWTELPEKIKDKVSPRRLTYALDYHKNSGDIRDMLPYESHPDVLAKSLGDAPVLKTIKDYVDARDYDGLRKELEDDNFFRKVKPHLVESAEAAKIILRLLSKERRMSLVTEGFTMETMVKNSKEIPEFQESMQTFISHQGNEGQISHAVLLIKRYKLEDLYDLPKANAKAKVKVTAEG